MTEKTLGQIATEFMIHIVECGEAKELPEVIFVDILLQLAIQSMITNKVPLEMILEDITKMYGNQVSNVKSSLSIIPGGKNDTK